MPEERRLYSRYPITCELRGKPLRPTESVGVLPLPAHRVVHGQVPNISAGGLCLRTDDKAEVFDPLRCEILAPQMPVGIPTLVQVRWVHKDDDGRIYRLGLQFLV